MHFWRYAKTDARSFHQLFETNKKLYVPCPSFFVVCRQIDIIEFTGPGVWSVSDKRQFVGKRQKNKGRASKVSCSAQKVVGNTWRPWGRFVKNAQFHPTKHLSRWVPELEAERYSTLSIFSAHRHFRFFCSRWPSFLRNDQWGDAKAYLWSVVKKKQKSPRKFIFVTGYLFDQISGRR